MSIIADRGLFVRLLVQSGKFASADAEAFADAMDAATREPATKLDLIEVRNELKGDINALRSELKGEINALRTELKGEITALRTEVKGEVTALRTEVKGDIAGLRQDVALLDQRITAMADRILVRVGGMGLALAGLLFAALRLLP